MNFQWYPGHMTKAKRQMQEDIKLIDLVIELVDARIPLSSRNPDIDELGKNKYRLILMNKADLADKERTREWSAFFKEKGFFVVSLDARSKSDNHILWKSFYTVYHKIAVIIQRKKLKWLFNIHISQWCAL